MRKGMTPNFLYDLAVFNLLDDIRAVPDGSVFESGARVREEPVVRKPGVLRSDNLRVLHTVDRLAMFKEEMPNQCPSGPYLVFL
jgi:hypothetical protein